MAFCYLLGYTTLMVNSRTIKFSVTTLNLAVPTFNAVIKPLLILNTDSSEEYHLYTWSDEFDGNDFATNNFTEPLEIENVLPVISVSENGTPWYIFIFGGELTETALSYNFILVEFIKLL